MQHLPGTDAVGLRLVGFNVRNGARLPTPGVVDEQLRIHAKELIQHFIVLHGLAGHIAHGEHPMLLQLSCITPADTPEVRERAVAPERAPIAHLVQFCDPDAVAVSRNMLCHDVHSDLAEVHVGADACRGRDARGGQNVQNDFHGELAGCKFVGAEVVGCIDEHLVDGIDMDILRRHILQVHIVDLGAGFHILSHLGRGYNIVDSQLRMGFQLGIIVGCPCEGATGSLALALCIGLLDLLHYLKEPRPAGDAVLLQSRRNGKADGFLRAAQIRHHKVGGHGVQVSLHTLDAGVKAFQIYCDIGTLRFHLTTSCSNFKCIISRYCRNCVAGM